ncbi:MAG: hypothetical protein J5645_01690 [Lachnospiraceae bacterium]|nr:hypothetical protein [Lachnospiraceae bacterium]
MSQCVRCQKDAEKEYRFVVVESVISSQSKEYIVARKTQTSIYEKYETVERVGICNSCIKKERNKLALAGTGFSLLFAVCLTLYTRAFTPGFLIAFGSIALISSIGFFVYSRTKKDAFYAADIRRNMSGKRYRYVPVEAGLYCSRNSSAPKIKIFKEKTGMRTEVADKVFEKFVIPGNGDEMIDSILASNGRPENL